MRSACLLALAAMSPFVHASWTLTILHPAGQLSSESFGASGNKQVGEVFVGADQPRAAIWSGTAASWVNLHPAGATASFAIDVSGTKQAGFAVVGGQPKASLWTGTASSWVNLHPSGATTSHVVALDASKQVGHAMFSGVDHAILWSGTAASAIDLHPAGSSESVARNVLNGKQVGYAEFGGHSQACIWSGTAASFVSLHPAGATDSVVQAISSTRQGGYASFGDIPHAALWSGTAASFVDLHPAGQDESFVYDILNDNLQVGYFKQNDLFRACTWGGSAATMVNLHATLPAGYSQSVAHGVSTDGVYEYISGVVLEDATDEFRAVVWKRPVSSGVTFKFTLNKTTVAGQNSVQGTITLSSAQTSSTVFTTYDNSSLVTIPANVTVAANTTVKNFQITVTAVTSPINTMIYAKLGSVTQSKPLTLAPLVPTSVSFTPNPVTGGQTTTGKVIINGVAGPGGRTIALFDNSPKAATPSSVVVPAGATQATFAIPTLAVTAVTSVTVTARVSAGEKTGTFRINP